MQRRMAIFLVGLLLIFTQVYALQVNVTPSPITATVSKSDPRAQFTATITLETNDDAVVVSITSANGSIGISGPTYVTSSGTYQYTLLFPSTPRTYTGVVVFKATGTSNDEYQVSFSVDVTAWDERLTDYFEKDVMYKVAVGSDNYLMKIKDLSTDAVTLYFDGTIYTIPRGDAEIVKESLKIEVDAIFSSGAVLKFYTDGDSVNVSKYTTASTGPADTFTDDLSGFHFLVSKYSKYIQEGMTYTVSVTLVNDTDYRVFMKDVYFENTTVTPDGEKPTRLEDYQLPSYLDPGQELTLKVTIDTRGLEVGKTYTPSLVALGRVGNQDVRAQVDFFITVVKSVQTGKSEEEKQEEEPQPQNTQPPAPKTMIIETVPQNPQPGDIVTIYVRDAKTREYINATITVNGQQTPTFEADWCQTYRISATANGYSPASRVITTKCKTMNVTYTPDKPKEGDTVEFTITDADTGEAITDAQIKIGGRAIAGTTWEAKAGTHTVVVTAPKYSQKSMVIKVEKKPVSVLSSMPTTLKTGAELNITLSREAHWEIYDSNGVLVASGTSSVISFTPSDPGTYTIKVEGKEVGTVEVEAPRTLGISFSGNMMWVLAAVGAALVIYDIYRKKRAAKQAEVQIPVGFDLRPKFATPAEGGAGGEGGSQQ